MPPVHGDKDLLAWSVRFETKFDTFMESHNKVHESMILDTARNTFETEQLKKDRDELKKENSVLFSKYRSLERKMITASGTLAGLVLALKLYDIFKTLK